MRKTVLDSNLLHLAFVLLCSYCVISLHSVESELSQPSRRATSSGSSMAGPFRVAACCRSFDVIRFAKQHETSEGNPAAIPHGDGGLMHFLCVDGGSPWFSYNYRL